ncbi:MAG: DUF1214 domain-containing protein [Devosiaceae bacterium]|nr:DUF1214 domain-containing protein [Devosiaceae bacterium MH13]
MARLLWLLSVGLTAAILGTASAIYASQTLKPTGMVRIGVWEAVSAVGDAAADPYAHAYIASSGQLPPGSAEGMRFVATQAGDGRALRPDCTITVSGEVEIARVWTLSVLTPNGAPLSAGRDMLAVHSQDIVYNRDGSFDLTIGPRPQTTNTLLSRVTSDVALVLHVYDGAIGSAPDNGDAALPTLSVGTAASGC